MNERKELEPADRLQLSYCYGGIVQYDPGEKLGARLLTDFEAVLIIEGFPTYETEAGFQCLEPGSILIAQPGTRETYHWDTKAKTRHAYLHFDLDKIPLGWQEPDSWPRIIISPPPILGQLFRHLTERALAHPDWPTEKPGVLDNHLFEACLELFLNQESGHGKISPNVLPEPIRRATKFMRERLDHQPFEPFTLDELADHARVTTKHLCRVFTNELGVSPMKACRLMQFQLAIPLLARSNMSIKEIAERCGFPDQLYFSRTVSLTCGQSPSKIRKSIQQGAPPPVIPLPPTLTPRLYW